MAADLARRLRRLERVAELMESRWTLPIVKKPVGLDGLIGLLPAGGDLVCALIALGVLVEGARMGASRGTVARGCLNIGIDFVIGILPLIGDYADVLYRVNTRNVAMIRRDLARSHPELGED